MSAHRDFDHEHFDYEKSAAQDFLTKIGAEPVSLPKFAVLLATLEEEGLLKVGSIADRGSRESKLVGDLLTATNPIARGQQVPEARGASSFRLLNQPDLIPLRIEKHNLGHNAVYNLGLSKEGDRLTASVIASAGLPYIHSSVEAQELLNDRAEIARLREAVYREYNEAIAGDISVQLGMVESRMARITGLATHIGIQLPSGSTAPDTSTETE